MNRSQKTCLLAGCVAIIYLIFQMLDLTSTLSLPALAADLSNSSCRATIVTAYFRMKSKHRSTLMQSCRHVSDNIYDNVDGSHAEYLSWMANMLTLTDCMVIFTQPELAATIRRLRPSHYPTHIVETLLNQEHSTHWTAAFIFRSHYIAHWRFSIVFLVFFGQSYVRPVLCIFLPVHWHDQNPEINQPSKIFIQIPEM